MVSPRGTRTMVGAVVPFGFTLFQPKQAWSVLVFEWNDSTEPRTRPTAFAVL